MHLLRRSAHAQFKREEHDKREKRSVSPFWMTHQIQMLEPECQSHMWRTEESRRAEDEDDEERVGAQGLSVLQAYVPSLQTRPAHAEWEHAIYTPAYCALFLHRMHRMKEERGDI